MHLVCAVLIVPFLANSPDLSTTPAGAPDNGLGQMAVQAAPVNSHDSGAVARDSKQTDDTSTRARRVLFITAKDSTRCDEELSRLRRPGGDFERLQARGWKIGAGTASHLQIIDRDTVPELVKQLHAGAFPTVACIEDGEIVRSFQDGCTTPLDMWTFGWLLKGIDERPAASIPEAARAETTGHYPLRGNHWSVDGDWTPARETVISHLRGPNHSVHLNRSWAIETWSYEELRSLHDNLHEQFGGGVSAGRAKSASGSTNQFSASRKITGR
jgi:hypothetical protein